MSTKPIGTLGTIPTVTVGGRVFTDLTNLITLWATGDGGASNDYATFRKPGASSGYTPSGSNKFHIYAVKLMTCNGPSSSGGFPFSVFYGDNDIGQQSSSSITNPKYVANTQQCSIVGIGPTSANNYQVNQPLFEMAFDFIIPNGKYAQFFNNDSSNAKVVCIYGYEEA